MERTNDHKNPPVAPGTVFDVSLLATTMPDKVYMLDEYVRWTLLQTTELIEILTTCGKERVVGEDILGYTYQSTTENVYTNHTGPMDFEFQERLLDLLERIADYGMLNEFPNNFKIRLLAGLDEANMILIDYEADEQPEVCDDCEPDHLSAGHSCEHGTDFFSSNYSVSIGPRVSDDERDSLLVHF